MKAPSGLGGHCVPEVVMQETEVCLSPERGRSAVSVILLV